MRRMSSVLVAALLSPLPLLAQDAEPGRQAPQGQPEQQPGQQGLPRATVRLLDPGAEPWQAFRYEPVMGQAEQASIVTRMTSSATINGMDTPPQKLPAMTLKVRQTPEETSESENVLVSFEFVGLDIEESGPMTGALRDAMAPIVGVRGSGEVTPRGETIRFEPDGAQDAGPMQEQIDSMSSQAARLGIIFPEEPVGLGGSWEIDAALTNSGMQMRQTVVATLDAIDDETLTIGITLTQSADPQDVEAPNLPQGARMRLTSLTGSGTGSMKVDPARLIPLSSSIATETSFDITVNMQGGEQPMSQSINMTVDVTGALAEDDAGEQTEEDPQDEPEAPDDGG